MCEIGSPNLIDLSIEDNCNQTKDIAKKSNVPLIPSPHGRLSLDNNPFDHIQNLANCTNDDPFDFVEKEASLKARESIMRPEVRMANLLSLSSESECNVSEFIQTSGLMSDISCVNSKCLELDNESPPVNFNTKFTPDSSTADSGSCESSDSARSSNSQRPRKGRQQRHRLLKLSISNATFNTPMSSRRSAVNEFPHTPQASSSINKELVPLTEENMLASESPLKFFDDDIMSEEPPIKVYTEKDYDADLELLEIPMLKQLNSESEKLLQNSVIGDMDTDTIACEAAPINKSSDKLEDNNVSSVAALPDIEAIRKKLQAKRTEAANKDITNLIKNLKMMICESDSVDEQKKEKVNGLLESLSTTLDAKSSTAQSNSPRPIVRQSTFDLDLQASNSQHHVEDGTEPDDNVHIMGQQTSNQDSGEIPEIMFKSSATYDGETAEERAHLNLPQIDPISPSPGSAVHPNINDVMEQIQLFLEQNQLNQQSQVDNSCASNTNNGSSIASNPTFIVVMPTISQLAVNEEFDDFGDENYNRRRSQSLSIHDKIKIVKLPIKPTPDIDSTENYESPPSNTMNASSIDIDSVEFKTPARYLSRRNSISSTTPYTPTRFSHARFNMSAMTKVRSSGLDTTQQSFATPSRLRPMETHNETQRSQLTLRPNFGLVKPDLKKKVRTANSILKSDGPLKATVPVNKIAPAVKTNSRNITSNTSIHLVAKSGHMAHTSTPVPPNRSFGLKDANKVYPAACSTPAALNVKSGSNTTRYSNIATTPVGKTLAVPSASTAGLKRRTISEFKSNSPLKPRPSIQDSSGSTVSTKNNYSKLNMNRPSVYSKNVPKTRASMGGTSTYLANKNKENKF